MKLSNFFLNTLREKPLEAQVISHQLMLRSGMIKQNVAGIYTWLPIGLMVLKKIENIVRKNMNKYGMIELLMPCIQSLDLWKESGRGEYCGKETLKIFDRHQNELIFSPTCEELMTDIFRSSIKSYKHLPKILYNIQWKFRDEIRPRFGVLRCREFLMKDAYSFDIDKKSAEQTYNLVYDAYYSTFKDIGVKVVPVRADNGAIGGDMSHEFHVMAENGESNIFYDKAFLDEVSVEDARKLYAVVEEKHDNFDNKDIVSSKGIEVGHIFNFGTKYSESMKSFVLDSTGSSIAPEMGSYGIGVSRTVAAIIEASHDEKGIVWPSSVAPFKFSLINIHPQDEENTKFADKIYEKMLNLNVEVLYDDTNERAGSKFATHDSIGVPYHIIVGKEKSRENLIEIKERKTHISKIVSLENFDSFLNSGKMDF